MNPGPARRPPSQALRGLISPLLAALLAVAAAFQEAPPPSPGVPTIRIEGTARPKIPIAVPPVTIAGADPRLREAAATLAQVLRDDLDFSTWFSLVPEEYHALVRGAGDRKVPFKEWLGVGAEVLLLGQVGLEGSQFVFEGRAFDTAEGRMPVGRKYRAEPDLLRVVAHRLSNEIVQHYTGQPGVALTRIAYVSQSGRAKEIHVMDHDGARSKRITGNGSINLSPTWSPDGREIAFMSYRGGSPELLILNSDGELRRTFPQHGELNTAPAWSPDGRMLAFSSSRDGNAEIYLLRIADGALTRLTRHEAIDTSPAWSPDGRAIAFTSDRSGSPQIYTMNADGSGVERLTFEVSYCDAPSWSPDGGRIAFTSRVPGGFDIFVQTLAAAGGPPGAGGGALRRLTENTNINEWPRWSPDGRHLVFASDRTGSFDIYTMDADGSHVRRLTRTGNSHSPAWSR
jgi:TolB protein